MSKFIAGQTYTTRSICDADSVVEVIVASRTAKTLTTAPGALLSSGKTLRIVTNVDGVESVKPWGSYSMAPIVKAAK